MTELQVWVVIYLAVGFLAVKGDRGLTVGLRLFGALMWPMILISKLFN